MTPWELRNCPKPVKRVKPLGKRGVIVSLRKPRKSCSDTGGLSDLRDPKNSSVRANSSAGKGGGSALPLAPSTLSCPNGIPGSSAADAAPETQSQITRAKIVREHFFMAVSLSV